MGVPPAASSTGASADPPPRFTGDEAESTVYDLGTRMNWARRLSHPGLAAAALTLALLLVGMTVYGLTHRIMERDIQRRLDLALALKQAIVGDWLEDSRVALAAWSDDELFLEAVAAWQVHPADPALAGAVLHTMTREARELDYLVVALCRANCAEPALVAARHGPPDTLVAITDPQPVGPYVVLQHPLSLIDPGLQVVVVPDASHEVARLSPLNSGEERGDLAAEVMRLSEGRLLPLEAFAPRMASPLQSLSARDGSAIGVDGEMTRAISDDGEPLLLRARDIPGTPWTAVATIDETRAFADLRHGAVIVVLMGALLAGLGTGWVYLVRQRTAARHARLRSRAAQARAAAELSQRVVAAQELERRRIVSQLHDDTCASLATVQLNFKTLMRRHAVPDPEDAELMQETSELLTATVAGFREFVNGLRPPELVYGGLRRAIEVECERFARRSGTPVELDVSGFETSLSTEVEYNVLRIVCEALNNCAKYARAGRIEVRLADDGPAGVTAEVADDGVGFDTGALAAGAAGQGLLIMRERAEAIRGTLSVTTAPGQGCKVRLYVPTHPLFQGPDRTS